jgi:hypothetical protein
MTDWISVKDGLPKNKESVIAWGNNDVYLLTFKKTPD